MSNYLIKFMITGISGDFGVDFAIDPHTWESEGANHPDIIWSSARTAIGSCFRPTFQKLYFSHRLEQEMEFEVRVEPDYTSWSDGKDCLNQPDSLKIFWGKKRTFVVKTVLYPESIELKGDS